MKTDVKNILVVRTDAIGDLILSEPVSQVIKSCYPDCKVSFLVSEYSAPILKFNPAVDDIISISKENIKFGFNNIISVIKNLKSKSIDTAIVLRPNWFNAVTVFLSNIENRIGTGYRLYSILFNSRKYEHRSNNLKSEMYYNLSMLEFIGISEKRIPKDIKPKVFLSEEEIKNLTTLLGGHGIRDEDRIILIHPGGRGSAPRWALEKYVKLISELSTTSDVKILISGLANEFDEAGKMLLNSMDKSVINMVGKLSLRQLIGLTSLSKLTVTNSTGVAHIAAALDVPLVAIYPDTPEFSLKRWSPVGIADNMIILSSEDVNTITLEEVQSACRKFLNK